MKKKIGLIILFIISLNLVGCSSHSVDLDKLRIDTAKENIKIENTIVEYNLNIEEIKKFDIIFQESLMNLNNIDNYSTELQSFVQTDRDLKKSILECVDFLNNEKNILSNENALKLDFYSFLDDTTGDIYEYVILNNSAFFIFTWKNGSIIHYTYEY